MCKAYIPTATMEVALNGFSKCGIFPFNPQIFRFQDFIVDIEDELHCLPVTNCNVISEQTPTSPNTQEQYLTVPGQTAQCVETSRNLERRQTTTLSPFQISPPPSVPKSSRSSRGGKAAVITRSPYKTMLGIFI